jgi:hypothetical protein
VIKVDYMDDGTGPRVRLMIAAAGTIIITGYVLFPSSLHGQTRRFMRRSNAPRRRLNNREQDEVHRRNSQIDGADDDSGRALLAEAEPTLAEEKFADEVPEGQRLAELVYEIAKDQAMQQGLVHHGVSCDACHTVPIRGVRFHCANCPDFGLWNDSLVRQIVADVECRSMPLLRRKACSPKKSCILQDQGATFGSCS